MEGLDTVYLVVGCGSDEVRVWKVVVDGTSANCVCIGRIEGRAHSEGRDHSRRARIEPSSVVGLEDLSILYARRMTRWPEWSRQYPS